MQAITFDEFKRAFSSANIGMHRALRSGSPEEFERAWRRHVLPLRDLAVPEKDHARRENHLDWFHDLAEVSGFGDVPLRLGVMSAQTHQMRPARLAQGK
jgi:hypothetical protein